MGCSFASRVWGSDFLCFLSDKPGEAIGAESVEVKPRSEMDWFGCRPQGSGFRKPFPLISLYRVSLPLHVQVSAGHGDIGSRYIRSAEPVMGRTI